MNGLIIFFLNLELLENIKFNLLEIKFFNVDEKLRFHSGVQTEKNLIKCSTLFEKNSSLVVFLEILI